MKLEIPAFIELVRLYFQTHKLHYTVHYVYLKCEMYLVKKNTCECKAFYLLIYEIIHSSREFENSKQSKKPPRTQKTIRPR